MKLSKKDIIKALPPLLSKDEFSVRYKTQWGGSAEYQKTAILANEIEAARYAREQWGAIKVVCIQLVREGIWA